MVQLGRPMGKRTGNPRGAPKGNHNRLIHGRYSAATRARRAQIRAIVKACDAAIERASAMAAIPPFPLSRRVRLRSEAAAAPRPARPARSPRCAANGPSRGCACPACRWCWWRRSDASSASRPPCRAGQTRSSRRPAPAKPRWSVSGWPANGNPAGRRSTSPTGWWGRPGSPDNRAAAARTGPGAAAPPQTGSRGAGTGWLSRWWWAG